MTTYTVQDATDINFLINAKKPTVYLFNYTEKVCGNIHHIDYLVKNNMELHGTFEGIPPSRPPSPPPPPPEMIPLSMQTDPIPPHLLHQPLYHPHCVQYTLLKPHHQLHHLRHQNMGIDSLKLLRRLLLLKWLTGRLIWILP